MENDKDKILANLVLGDFIAFEWAYGMFGREIIVAPITLYHEDEVLVHFLYGYQSESEFIKKSDIIAVGSSSANGKIKGWSGNFNILIPDHELLQNKEKEKPVVAESDSDCDNCLPVMGMYLGTGCPKCNRPFRMVFSNKL